MNLKSVLTMTDEEIRRAEWRAAHATIVEMHRRLQVNGSRETWCDWLVHLAAERGREPSKLNVDRKAECQANRQNAAISCHRCGRKQGEGCGEHGPYADPKITEDLEGED